MAIDIQENGTRTFRFHPPELWTGATAQVLGPSGTILESPSPSASTVDTTVASATARDSFVITSASGVVRGDLLLVSDPTFGSASAEVSAVDGTTIRLTSPLPAVPDGGSTVKGLTQTVSITTASTSERNLGCRVVLKYSGQQLSFMFNVVRHPFRNPIDSRVVREYVAQWFPSDPILEDEEALANIGERSGQMLRGRLMTIGMYPHQYVDPEAFIEPARCCMRSILADENRIPAGADPIEYHRSMQFDLRDLIANIKHSLQPLDTDDDGDTEDTNYTGLRSGFLER